jgi:hypothetical protein
MCRLKADGVFGDHADGRAGHANAVQLVKGELRIVLQLLEAAPEEREGELGIGEWPGTFRIVLDQGVLELLIPPG